MIEQLKLGFKMMRYTFGIKMCVIIGAIFLVLGLAMECLPPGMSMGGGAFVMVCGMWPAQLIYSLAVSNMVKTSKYAKAMETSVPTSVCFVPFVLCYIVIILFKLPRLSGATEEMLGCMSAELIVCACIAAGLMVFCGIAFKLFTLSVIIVFVLCCSSGILLDVFSVSMPFGMAVIIGFAILVAGALLQYVLSCLLYKIPLAKGAQLRGLQKYM